MSSEEIYGSCEDLFEDISPVDSSNPVKTPEIKVKMGDTWKRSNLHNKLKIILKQADGHSRTPLSLLTAEELMVRTEEVFNDFKAVQTVLENTAKDETAFDVQAAAGELVENTFSEARSKLRAIIKNLSTPRTSPGGAGGSGSSAPKVKLPAITLPSFEGSFEHWTSFKDLFSAAVDNNVSLSDSQKLQYLKSALSGEPQKLIDYLTTTDSNYLEAWRILEERYNNKIEIVRAHTYKLLDLKPVKVESAHHLQMLVDDSIKCVRSLNVLGCPTDKWDDLLNAIVEKKLDPATRREWAKHQAGKSAITFEEFRKFLESHIRGLQAAGISNSNQSSDRRGEKQLRIHHAAEEVGQCQVCQGPHIIQDCKEFRNKNPAQRSIIAKEARLCFNCLKSDHMIRNCPSQKTCRKCGKKHHTFLHEDRDDKPSSSRPSTPNSLTSLKPPTVSGNCVTSDTRGVVMTVIVNVLDRYGVPSPCRVFIDPGAQADFISESCTSRLGLAREASRVQVRGFGDTNVGTSKGVVRTTLHSRVDASQTVEVELHIMNKLTGRLPGARCRNYNWKHLNGLQLADPSWYQPGQVDILLGVKYFHKILLHKRIIGSSEDDPVAWETIFGWVVAGACPEDRRNHVTTFSIQVDQINDQLRKFWEVEEPPRQRILTEEEKKCEDHFKRTYHRNEAGRFICGVPFDDDKKKGLGKSYEIAKKRLFQVERRLQKKPVLQQMYVDFINEYESLNHMSLITPDECGERVGSTNYLCHHFVTNDSSTTTKLRVVFDGSAATSTGVSLNDTMMVGATLQDELYDLLLRFRSHAVVLKADIAKMFRQFRLKKEDADFHRILWRADTSQPIREYRLDTVTYGTACAPNLSTRCLQQLGLDCANLFPKASRVLLNDAYIDDILTGVPTEEEAMILFKQLSDAVATAGLQLRKWTSNSATVMKFIPVELREAQQFVFEDEEVVKALGVMWQPSTDNFCFKKISFKSANPLTKRTLLSELARVFDPLGLLSCVILRGKLLLQELWKLPVGWDDAVPEDVNQVWVEYKNDLENLPTITIPRCIVSPRAKKLELHAFADSSERGFGSIVYLRNVINENLVEVNLVTSKTRVAPVRQVTLPRLELCAAVMAAELIIHVKECLKLDAELYLWSDSTITLTWIAASPRRWKTYIANRVAKIQELVPIAAWRHVAGVENPADLASRGCSVKDLQENQLWWKGPDWLSRPFLPEFPVQSVNDVDLEERPATTVVNFIDIDEHPFLLRFSSLENLKRCTAWILRYFRWRIFRKCQSGPLTALELKQAMSFLVLKTQGQFLQKDLESLHKCGHVPVKSKLKSLFPFIDSFGILRVSGRLRHAKEIPVDAKHQIIIPGESHLAKLIIESHHSSNYHGGFQLTWSSIQREYWMLGGRDKVRYFVRSCVRCRRFRAKVAEQLMGDLPVARVTPSRPFLHTGVDYAGPFVFKDVVGRIPKTYKGYMCIFVCLATKAIHLEAVSSLSTEGFLAALRRFVARRGLCGHIYSDCGTNFVGAERELRLAVQIAEERAAKDIISKGIQWNFNPPAAPHRGGLWEAGVKSAKSHLRRVVGATPLTFEQFSTLLAQIEAVLNSRPLHPMSPDPTDLQPLTPGHFLIGDAMTAVPDVDIKLSPANRLSHYQRIQQQVQHFWQRWSRDYLNTLQQRTKWMWEKADVKVGDLVLLIEETPPGTWKMGRILKVHPGVDGHVRLATVKTANNVSDRVITKLVPLLNAE